MRPRGMLYSCLNIQMANGSTTSRYTEFLIHVRTTPINGMLDWNGDRIPQIRKCALSAGN